MQATPALVEQVDQTSGVENAHMATVLVRYTVWFHPHTLPTMVHFTFLLRSDEHINHIPSLVFSCQENLLSISLLSIAGSVAAILMKVLLVRFSWFAFA